MLGEYNSPPGLGYGIQPENKVCCDPRRLETGAHEIFLARPEDGHGQQTMSKAGHIGLSDELTSVSISLKLGCQTKKDL